MGYSNGMDVKKKNLDALKAQFGLVRATDIPCETKRPPRRQQMLAPAGPPQTTEMKKDGALLSDALTMQLRARLGLSGSPPPSSFADACKPAEIEQVLPGQIVGGDSEGFFLYRQTFPLDLSLIHI